MDTNRLRARADREIELIMEDFENGLIDAKQAQYEINSVEDEFLEMCGGRLDPEDERDIYCSDFDEEPYYEPDYDNFN